MTPEVITKILSLLQEGQSLRRICKENADVPARENVFDYLDKNEDFATKYARAKEIGTHALIEDTLDIADSAKDRTGVEKARVQIQARQWAASKLNPKKYGDKLDITSGNDKITAVSVEIVRRKEQPDITPENPGI